MVRGWLLLGVWCLCGCSGAAPLATGGGLAEAPAAAAEVEGLRLFWGHRQPAQAFVFSADGSLLYSATGGEEVIAWDLAAGVPIRKFIAPLGEVVTGLVLAADGSYLAVADSVQIHFFAPHNGTLLRTLRLPASQMPGESVVEITALSAAATPDHLLVGDSLGRISLFDVQNGTSKTIYRTGLQAIQSVINGHGWIGVSDRRRTMVLDSSKDPVPLPVRGTIEGVGLRDMVRYDKVLAGTDGDNILLWGPNFAESARAIRVGQIGRMALAPAKDMALLINGNGELEAWRLDKRRRQEVGYGETRLPALVGVDPTAKWVVTAEQAALVVRSVSEGRQVHRLEYAIVPHFLMFEPGTHRFLVAGNDGRPARYDLKKPTTLEPFSQMAGPISAGVLDMATNGFFATTEAGEVLVFDYKRGRIARYLTAQVGPKPRLALAGARLALASERRGLDATGLGDLVVWDLAADKAEATLNVTDVVDVQLALSGTRVYYASRSGILESWDYRSQQRGKEIDGHNKVVRRLRQDPGGMLLALCGDAGISFYSPSLQLMWFAPMPGCVDVAFSHDGTRLVAATAERQVNLVYFEGDQVRSEAVVRMPTAVTSMAVSSSNDFLLVGEARGTVSVFDLRRQSTQPQVTLQIYDEGRWVVYTPHGRFDGQPGDRVRFDVQGEIVRSIGGNVRWGREAGAVYQALDL